jgi:hypothetical protein
MAFNMAASTGGSTGAIVCGYLADQEKKIILKIGCIVSIAGVYCKPLQSNKKFCLQAK